MSLTISSNGLSSSPLDASGFFSAGLAAELDRGFDLSCSPPFWAASSGGEARPAISSRVNIVSLVWFIALRKVEDAWSAFPERGPAYESSKSQPFTPGNHAHGKAFPRPCPQLWPEAQGFRKVVGNVTLPSGGAIFTGAGQRRREGRRLRRPEREDSSPARWKGNVLRCQRADCTKPVCRLAERGWFNRSIRVEGPPNVR